VALTTDSVTQISAVRDWRTLAACRDTAPDLFFPVGSTGLAVEQIEAAKAVCDQCPVKEACLQFALETNQDSGIWGGTSEEERRRLRRNWLRDRAAVR
jgi:WhiB family transcriptional regulator, redox-sensing transcriptional regulator